MATRRPNSHHRNLHDESRTIPLLVGDDGFPRDNRDQECSTVLVLKLYPHKMFFSCVVASKGPDPLVVGRLVKFIKDAGLMHFAYRSDKEPSIIALIEEACSRAGRRGVPAKVEDDVADLDEGEPAWGKSKPEDNPHTLLRIPCTDITFSHYLNYQPNLEITCIVVSLRSL